MARGGHGGEAECLARAKLVTALLLKNPSTTVLAQLGRLRAYAFLMTNDKGSADRTVLDMVERALSHENQSRCSAYSRTMLFAVLRNCLLRSHGGQRGGDRPHLTAISNAWMARALMHLSFFDREAVVLTVSMGFSDEETGSICKCAPELVKHRRSIGLAALAELFEASSAICH
jgi:DNA-directed RNA polymerase specialized sigma24 family protein